MLLLNAELVDGEVRLALGIRRPHPSMRGWSQAFSLVEITEITDLMNVAQGLSTTTLVDSQSQTYDLLHQTITIVTTPGVAHWTGGGAQSIAVVSARHEVIVDLTSRQVDPRLSHTLTLMDGSGAAHAVVTHHHTPAIASVLRRGAQLPVTLVVNAVHDQGTAPLSPEATTVLSAFFAMSNVQRAAHEAELRRERSANARDDDDVAYLVDKLGVALSHLAGVVERRASAVEAMVTHVLGTARMTVTLARQPTLVTLTATLPRLRAVPSVSFSRAAGIADAIRNRRDVQCGVAAVDDAFIIRGDADAAAAIAEAAANRLLSLGVGTTLTLDADELSIRVMCSDPHPGCHAALARQVAGLWEALVCR
jgi:hypothetical protein